MKEPQENPYVNNVIGRLDRILSEFLDLCKGSQVDHIDLQTLKHHADDLIGVGQKALELIADRNKPVIVVDRPK